MSRLFDKARECLEIYIEYWVFMDVDLSVFWLYCRDDP